MRPHETSHMSGPGKKPPVTRDLGTGRGARVPAQRCCPHVGLSTNLFPGGLCLPTWVPGAI